MKINYLICIVLVLASCKNTNKQTLTSKLSVDSIAKVENDSIKEFEERVKFYEESWRIENYIVDKEIALSDSLKVVLNLEGNCALFKSPNKEEIEILKEEDGEEDFYTIADDNLFYVSEARQFLDSVELEQVNLFESRFVRFVTLNSDTIYVDLRGKYSMPWNLLFFSPKKGVVLVDITDIENEYKKFYLSNNQ